MSICFCLTLALPVGAARPNQSSVGQLAHTTVLVLGDSLSAAYGLAPQQGWVALLQQKFSASGSPIGVVNASISGETTGGGRSRLPKLLKRHQPTLVVVALGANDGLRGLPAASMQENLNAMAAAVGAQGGKLVIAGMRLPPNYGADYDAQFRAVFGRVAQRYNAVLVPFLLEGFAHERELFQADGVHPTAAAQRLILKTMWPAIQLSLQTSPAAATTPR